MRHLILALTLILTPAMAVAYERVSNQQSFVALISGKALSNRFYGVSLNLSQNGSIAGKAWGANITGNWAWNNGFFCREMTWGDYFVGYNCQLVEVRSGNELRFTSDQGTGDNASFKLG